ncbi:MAG TPA: hypothetical protein VL051_02405 [Burkholderiaceae bacterium]|nr:hypothetical protein [Burkholderiaceae bacterium]
MKRTIAILIVAASLGSSLVISGCTQMPTEKQSVSDLRPQISFSANDIQLHGARVILDGLDMGIAGNYLEGSSALRVLSGTHVLRIVLSNQIILEEKFYVSDGVNRTFILK